MARGDGRLFERKVVNAAKPVPSPDPRRGPSLSVNEAAGQMRPDDRSPWRVSPAVSAIVSYLSDTNGKLPVGVLAAETQRHLELARAVLACLRANPDTVEKLDEAWAARIRKTPLGRQFAPPEPAERPAPEASDGGRRPLAARPAHLHPL
jgi:hypothetical protein